jgi:hypothetical protein
MKTKELPGFATLPEDHRRWLFEAAEGEWADDPDKCDGRIHLVTHPSGGVVITTETGCIGATAADYHLLPEGVKRLWNETLRGFPAEPQPTKTVGFSNAIDELLIWHEQNYSEDLAFCLEQYRNLIDPDCTELDCDGDVVRVIPNGEIEYLGDD